MRVTISTSDRLELHSLHEWLRHDAGLAGAADVSLASSGRHPGEQGALDIIEVVLGNATAIGSLAVSIASWRLARRRELEITLGRGGREVTTDAGDAATIEKTIGDLPPDQQDGTPRPGPRT